MLLKIVLVPFLFCAVSGLISAPKGPGNSRIKCCIAVSARRIPYEITHYKKQPESPLCVKAIIFYTATKGVFCTDSRARWAINKMKQIDIRPQGGPN